MTAYADPVAQAEVVRLRAHVAELEAREQRVHPVWSGLADDGEYEYTTTGDCHGTWEQYMRRRPALRAEPTRWEPVGPRVALDGTQP